MSLYIGRGDPSMYEDYIDFINYVFGYYHRPHDFITLMPRRCRAEYDPCSQTYFVVEDGKIKASVGAFDSEYDVCGERIKVRGIGNVSVHPYSQHKGYMIRLMNMIIEDMIKDGVDLSPLGGRRQRYGYFGYEQGCAGYSMTIDRDNFRYVYGGGRDNLPFSFRLRAEKVESGDKDRLDYIWKMNESQPVHCLRDRESLYDWLREWTATPWVFTDETGALRGYAVGKISELILDDDSLTPDAVWAMLEATGSYSLDLNIPLNKRAQREALMSAADGVSFHNGEMISVLNWKRVILAAMKLASTYQTLADGAFTVKIHGTAGDETLRIAVSGGVPSAMEYDGEPDAELDRLRAVSFFFGVYSPERDMMSAAVRSWLPLPVTLYSADSV